MRNFKWINDHPTMHTHTRIQTCLAWLHGWFSVLAVLVTIKKLYAIYVTDVVSFSCRQMSCFQTMETRSVWPSANSAPSPHSSISCLFKLENLPWCNYAHIHTYVFTFVHALSNVHPQFIVNCKCFVSIRIRFCFCSMYIHTTVGIHVLTICTIPKRSQGTVAVHRATFIKDRAKQCS